MSQAMTQSDRAAETLKNQPIVETAWAADDGYVIAILDRGATARGNVFQAIDAAEHEGHDAEVEFREWLHDGQERDSLHLRTEEHVQRCPA